MAGKPRKVALLHHLGGGNLGDDGTMEAAIENIRKRWPEAQIIGLSMNPEDTKKRHGIISYPIRQRTWKLGHQPANAGPGLGETVKSHLRRFPSAFALLRVINFLTRRVPGCLLKELVLLSKAARLLPSLDLLVVCGGGQFIESTGGAWEFLGGPWHFPFTLLKWVFAAKLARVPCVILNVGAGPLARPLSKLFVRSTLLLSDYASFRDRESRLLVHGIGFRGKTHLRCDSAYSLDLSGIKAVGGVPERREPTVGLAPMAYGDPRVSSKHPSTIYDEFTRRLGDFGSWLFDQGHNVTLFCTDIGIDPPAVEDVERMIRRCPDRGQKLTNGSLNRVHQWSTRELLMNMASMDYAVVCRFHAVVFAHMLNIPVLAIAHHPKVRSQMKDLGLSEYCVETDRCDLDTLIQTFESLKENREEIKHRMACRLRDYRKLLAVQFDEIFPPEALRAPAEAATFARQPG